MYHLHYHLTDEMYPYNPAQYDRTEMANFTLYGWHH